MDPTFHEFNSQDSPPAFNEPRPTFASYGHEDKARRLRFFRQVMWILAGMVLSNIVISIGIILNRGLFIGLLQNAQTVGLVSLFASLVSSSWLENAARERRGQPVHSRESVLAPLICFTFANSVLVSVPVCVYTYYGIGHVVFDALIVTLMTFVGLATIAYQSKYDFTIYNGLCASTLVLMLEFSVLGLLFGFSLGLGMICAGIFLFSGFVVIDTQLILSRLGPDDAVLGAVHLYLDVVNLFLKLMRLIAILRGEDSTSRRQRQERTDTRSMPVAQTCTASEVK